MVMLIIADELRTSRLHVTTNVTFRRGVNNWSSWNWDEKIHFAWQIKKDLQSNKDYKNPQCRLLGWSAQLMLSWHTSNLWHHHHYDHLWCLFIRLKLKLNYNSYTPVTHSSSDIITLLRSSSSSSPSQSQSKTPCGPSATEETRWVPVLIS